MDYLQYSLYLLPETDPDVPLALLQLFEVDSIWQEDSVIHAFFKNEYVNQYSGDFTSELQGKLGVFLSKIESKQTERINWNKEWESNFPTVEIDKFCYIYADFHEQKSGFQHMIKIAPKMAFGTGHHETTYMMIQTMEELVFEGQKVLDLGCGTGILAILAAKLGSEDIFAIDIEQPAYENTLEHLSLNKIECKVACGGVEDVPDKDYDIILANINRRVLLEYSENIMGMMNGSKSLLLISGILEQDASLIREAYAPLKLLETKQRGKWLCFRFQAK